jgi:hypothetical protein
MTGFCRERWHCRKPGTSSPIRGHFLASAGVSLDLISPDMDSSRCRLASGLDVEPGDCPSELFPAHQVL